MNANITRPIVIFFIAVSILAEFSYARPIDWKVNQEIDRLALHGLDSANLELKDGKVILYGTRTNGADTRNGDWACAKVVSVVLRKAGTKIPITLGVGRLEDLMRKWEKVVVEDSLKPGDVIVWTNRLTGRKDKRCTGGGNCHVGIVTKEGYFHNNPLGDSPTFDGLGLLGFQFKIGYRY